MLVMLAKLVPMITAPSVTPSTINIADGARIAMGFEPSMVAPRNSPTMATTRPIAEEAFIVRLPRCGWWGECRSWRGSAGRGGDERERCVAAPLGRGREGGREDRGAPLRDGSDDDLGRVGDQDLLMRGQRHHRVGRRVDGDDQIRVEVEALSPRG